MPCEKEINAIIRLYIGCLKPEQSARDFVEFLLARRWMICKYYMGVENRNDCVRNIYIFKCTAGWAKKKTTTFPFVVLLNACDCHKREGKQVVAHFLSILLLCFNLNIKIKWDQEELTNKRSTHENWNNAIIANRQISISLQFRKFVWWRSITDFKSANICCFALWFVMMMMVYKRILN